MSKTYITKLKLFPLIPSQVTYQKDGFAVFNPKVNYYIKIIVKTRLRFFLKAIDNKIHKQSELRLGKKKIKFYCTLTTYLVKS